MTEAQITRVIESLLATGGAYSLQEIKASVRRSLGSIVVDRDQIDGQTVGVLMTMSLAGAVRQLPGDRYHRGFLNVESRILLSLVGRELTAKEIHAETRAPGDDSTERFDLTLRALQFLTDHNHLRILPTYPRKWART